MTREALMARKLALEQQRDQLIANGNALTGAIKDCEYWLSVIDEEDKKAEEMKEAANG